MNKKPIILCILDGWGIGNDSSKGNAIALAKTPYYDSMLKTWPNIEVGASGKFVGLPDGQIGNSEVGHLNIGAGRIVFQGLSLINLAVAEGNLFTNKTILKTIENCVNNDSNLHLMGLLSNGGVHSHIDHLKGLIDVYRQHKNKLSKIFIHAFLDGRDVDPKSAKVFIKELLDYIKNDKNIFLASVGGRYYGMDRDKRWNRIEKSYENIVFDNGSSYEDVYEYIDNEYANGRSDEFVIPASYNNVDGRILDGDSVVHFNFRPDRAIQFSSALTNPKYLWVPKNKPSNLYFVSMMKYADSVIADLIFPPVIVNKTLGEILSKDGYSQLRLAETEKIAHVTFFFDGGIDKIFPNSKRDLIPSPKVATYDLKPEMSAYEITDSLIKHIQNQEFDFIIMNYANADMVGHTGKLKETIKAIEVLDECFRKFVPVLLKNNGVLFLTADHGNAEIMLDDDGNPVTKHSINKVPLIITDKNVKFLSNQAKLGDIAPTILYYIKEEKPSEMSGKILIK